MSDPTKTPHPEPLGGDESPRADAGPPQHRERPAPGREMTKREVGLVVGVTAAAAAHAMLPRPTEPGKESAKEQDPDDDAEAQAKESAELPSVGLDYGPVGEIVSTTVFAGEQHTGEVLDGYVDLYRGVFSHDRGTVTYFDARGNKLKEAVLPDNWYTKMSEAEKQEWYNRHRQETRVPKKVLPAELDDLGYPFIATASVYGMDKREDVDTPFELLDDRLKDEVEDPSKRYFQGRKITLRQAIIEIATAYDVPRAVAFGIGANESAFDREAESDAGAKGLFQLTPRGYEEARQYAAQHPELSASIRHGKLLQFEQRFHGTREWKNRFVSIEMSCAYYRFLQENLEPNFEQLEERLRKIDPTLLVGTFDTIGTITAYNAGPPRIKQCIQRFIKLSDEELTKKIGEPPYGVDVWMAVLAHSFGATLLGPDGKPILHKSGKKKGKPVKTRIGPHVLAYAPKSLALGSLIMDEENHLSNLEREREEWEMPEEENPPSEETVKRAPGESRRGLLKAVAGLTGIGAVAGGAFLGVQAVQERPISRRTALKGAAATAAVVLPFGKLGSFNRGTPKSGEEPSAPPGEPARYYLHEKYDANLIREAKANLDATYKDLVRRGKRKKRKKKGEYDWTPTEMDRIRQYTTPRQIQELRQDYEAVFGEDWVGRFSASVGKPLAKRRSIYEEGQRLQDDYIKDKLKTGDWVLMQEDNAGNPYFCEQVGHIGGTGNDKESLYMHKEFVPLLGTLIELVNHQIDLFNQTPAAYGQADPDFPFIPHVNAVKISGALRSVLQTYHMLEQGHGGVTRNLSNHWIGQAIDLGSFRTPNSHMVTFAEPFYGKRNPPLGAPELAANSKLPSQGFGKRTREILSKMFGRALLALEEPLKEKGIKLMPLWEGGQLNWHVGIKFRTL